MEEIISCEPAHKHTHTHTCAQILETPEKEKQAADIISGQKKTEK